MVENRVKASVQMKDSAAGIGLSNVRRRLNLLYPGRHQLDIVVTQDFYRVTLKIKI
jgi:LytS/YehU family sensor histidine kinase